jgi:hypothetical protein
MHCTFLTSRNQYATCHVFLPGDDQPLGAIYFQEKFYGFYKRTPRVAQLLKLILKLYAKPTEVLITQNPKGYFLWLWEPEAKMVGHIAARKLELPPAPFHLLEASRTGFCQIRVPDLDQPLVAVSINEKYYSLFKLEPDTQAIMEIIAKLTQRGDEVAIALTRGGYAICVLEPEASLVAPKT